MHLLLTSRPANDPAQRAVPVYSHLISTITVHVIHIAALWRTALQYIIRRRITGILIRTTRESARRSLWDLCVELVRVEPGVNVLTVLTAVPADVRLSERVAAEDVVYAFQGRGT